MRKIKNTLALSLITLSFPTFGQNTIWKVDSVITFSINDDTSRLFVPTYNSLGQTTELINRKWESGGWKNVNKKTFTYNANGDTLVDQTFPWEQGGWATEGGRRTNTYDANFNKTQALHESYYNNTYEISEKITWTYDANNNVTSKIFERDNSGVLAPLSKNKYSYQSNLLDSLLTQSSVLDTTTNNYDWVNHSLVVYVYDGNNNAIEKTTYSWDEDNDNWEYNYLSNLTYNSGNLQTEIITYNWNSRDTDWVKNSRAAYSYNNNNKSLVDSFFTYDKGNDRWYLDGSLVRAYDNDNNLVEISIYKDQSITEEYTYEYDANGNSIKGTYQWENTPATEVLNVYTANESLELAVSGHYYIATFKEIEKNDEPSTIEDTKNHVLRVFPNPFNNLINIQFQNPTTGTVEMFDFQGRKIWTKSISQTSYASFNLENLPNGIFQIRVVDNTGKVLTKKIIKH